MNVQSITGFTLIVTFCMYLADIDCTCECVCMCVWLKEREIGGEGVKKGVFVILTSLVQVFLEVLRLYPPGVGTSRESPSDDFHLSGYAIPKGTIIALSFYTNHRNPDHWDDPETFDPSRFSPSRGK